jgi:small subunit ribosomal protein S15Ae
MRLFFPTILELIILSYSGYIGEFEIIDDHRSGKIVIQLNGHLNKTGVISPRFNIQHSQIESWVNLLLPARGFGILILVRVNFSIFAYEP